MAVIDIGNFCKDLRNAWFLLVTARKQSLGQGNIFAPICHSVHRGSTWAGTPGRYTPLAGTPPWAGTPPGRYPPLVGTPSWAGTPPWQVHPWAGTPPDKYTPGQVHSPVRYTPGQVHPRASTPPSQVHPPGRYTPWAGTPPGRYIPLAGTPPGSSACWEIRATSGRYAPYWNAFLFSFSDVSVSKRK